MCVFFVFRTEDSIRGFCLWRRLGGVDKKQVVVGVGVAVGRDVVVLLLLL